MNGCVSNPVPLVKVSDDLTNKQSAQDCAPSSQSHFGPSDLALCWECDVVQTRCLTHILQWLGCLVIFQANDSLQGK